MTWEHSETFRTKLADLVGLEGYELELARILHRLEYHFQLKGSRAETEDPKYQRLFNCLSLEVLGQAWIEASRVKYKTWKLLRELRGHRVTDLQVISYCLKMDLDRNFSQLVSVHELIWSYLESDSYASAASHAIDLN